VAPRRTHQAISAERGWSQERRNKFTHALERGKEKGQARIKNQVCRENISAHLLHQHNRSVFGRRLIRSLS